MSITRARTFGVVGQSYGREGYGSGDSYAAFTSAISEVIESSASTIQTNIGGSPAIASGQLFGMWNGCVNGSAVWQDHAGSAGYWVSSNATSAGPLLTTALSNISALSAKPILLVDSHGEQDATAANGDGLESTVITAWEYKLLQLRTGCNATTPTDVPVWVDILGIRYSADEADEYALRDAMLGMISSGTNIFRGAEKYAVVLDSSTHPCEDFSGYARLGAWTGRKVAAWLVDGSELRGPSISGAVRSGSNVTVSITVPATKTLVKPTEPEFFGLFNASGDRLEITGYSWSGNDLTLTCDGTPTTFRYPARQEKRCNIKNVVRLSDPSSPYFAGEPGLPLESTVSISL